ncbi:MAG: Ribonuclease HI [Methanomassiliicoccales archaeon PtaU1.Bin124]|nr:MAG: Ribonuclease HI [Methanomassiliicoccales archaeon PtaU1.Bin124]
MKLMLYSDGGSRGNPGPAAYAFIACDEQGKVLKQGSRYLGVMTNNEAEYLGLLAALQAAESLQADQVTMTMDSELVVKQVRGEYRMKAGNLAPLLQEARNIIAKFSEFKIQHVPRENPMISKADRMVNEELDICSSRKR